MRPSPKNLVGLAFLGLAAGAFVLFGTFGSSSVCGGCGAVQRSTEWQIPFTSVTYWESTFVVQTPLSAVVARVGLPPCAPHNWLFAHGSGNGVMCAISDGRHIHQAAASPQVAAFVSAVSQYRGPTEARRWVKMILDPAASRDVRSLVVVSNIPESGFADREAFERWWQEHRDFIDPLLTDFGGVP
jgi:hypothetical protein